MRRGKVVLVPFPFDDIRSSKVRPAVCVTEVTDEFNHIVVAFIGTKIPDTLLPTDILILATDPEIVQTGLHFESVIRVNRLLTTATPFIKKEIGKLSENQWSEIIKRLRLLFNLAYEE